MRKESQCDLRSYGDILGVRGNKTINSHCSGKVKNPTGKYRFESVRSLDKTS